MTKDSAKGIYTSPDGSAMWEYIATASCALIIFCVGCIPGWTSPSLSILMNPDSPMPLTPSEASTLSAMISVGHAVVPTLIMVMEKKIGRKNCLLISGIPTIISWALISAFNNYMVLLVARFIGGLSLGLIYCFPPMYLGEIASAKLRGAMSMVCGTMINAGLLFMFVVAPYLSIRTTACISLSIVTIAVIGVWFIPESPYFLAMVGKMDEAEAALEKLRGKADVSEELELIKMTISQTDKGTNNSNEGEHHEAQEKVSALKQLFFVTGNRRALFIALLFCMALFFGSYAACLIYGQIIFNKMKAGVKAHICMMMMAVTQIICNILTAFIIDKLGRRPLIFISGLLSGFCVLLIGVYFYLMEYTSMDVTPYAMFAVCAMFVNIIALNIGLTPLQHVIQSEIFATEVKGVASCIIGIVGGIMAIIGIKSYLMLAETWKFGYCVPFFIFAVTTWVCTTLILIMLPETKGKTLFEIQRDLNA